MENMPEGLDQLIDRFKEHLEQYRSASYDEANTRTDFIDPLFELLGWDVANRSGYSEQYREVIRLYGINKGVPTACLSRAEAGLRGTTLIVNLPGSLKAVQDGMDFLIPLLPHALEMMAGKGH
jgi:hypothetical protein